jgi:hypothetical protein
LLSSNLFKYSLQQTINEFPFDSRDSWSASVSEWFIKQGRCIWLQRNEKTYNTTQSNQSRLEKETFAQVRKLYETSELLSANDKEIFATPLEEFIQQPWHILNTWVNTAWPTVRACLEAQTERILAHQPRITEFFSSISSEIAEDKDTPNHLTTTSNENSQNQDTNPESNYSASINQTEHLVTHQQQTQTTPRSRIPLPASEI